MMQEESASAYN